MVGLSSGAVKSPSARPNWASAVAVSGGAAPGAICRALAAAGASVSQSYASLPGVAQSDAAPPSVASSAASIASDAFAAGSVAASADAYRSGLALGTPMAQAPSLSSRWRNMYSRDMVGMLVVEQPQAEGSEDGGSKSDRGGGSGSGSGSGGGSDGGVALRDLLPNPEASPRLDNLSGLRSLAIDSAGRHVATGDNHGNVRVFDVSTSKRAAFCVWPLRVFFCPPFFAPSYRA